ncbi:UDP pyrophosphate phosphatase [Paraburkholderia fungorum]
MSSTAGRERSGGFMDLAMAMGVALFGMFAASTVYFFYTLER